MTATIAAPAAPTVSAADRAAAGKALRDRVPRSGHSAWTAPADRPDPVALLARTCDARLGPLVPLRNARMAESPFAFFRGSADIMASDLARTPATGLHVQMCGDAHCLNFGAYATPERRLIFDVTDFDETLPGPWEWDLKRLAASLVLAARSVDLKAGNGNIPVLAAVRAYRLRMLELAPRTALETWYARVEAASVGPDANLDDRRRRKQIVESAESKSMRAAVENITVAVPDGRRFREEPPLLYHPDDELPGGFDVATVLATYARSLSPEVRVLFGRYRLTDCAVNVVGVGSIGTRCSVALMRADGDDFLILQIKEALASDALVGWGTTGEHDFYVRQFKDKKGAANIAAMDGFGLREYAEMCGRTLAKAHARSGDAVQIAAYLGKADTFDKALVRFASLYADQAEQDYTEFLAAIDERRIPVSKTPPAASVRREALRA
jgi:hypothetical protein